MKFLANILIYLISYIPHNKRPLSELNVKGIHNEFRVKPTKFIFSKNKTKIKIKIKKTLAGYDQRYNESTDSSIMDDIAQNIYKKEILDTLTGVKVSILVKMDIVEELSKENNTMAYNLEAGGLYDDWNMDF
jgi:hypothetical protein